MTDKKAIAENLVAIYVDQVMSTDSEAGRHGMSMHEALVASMNYVGGGTGKAVTARCSLASSGGGNRPDTKMIRETTYLRNPHHNFRYAKYLMGEVKHKKEEYFAALVAVRVYQYQHSKSHTQKDAAERLGWTEAQFKNNYGKGLKFMIQELQRDERKEQIMSGEAA